MSAARWAAPDWSRPWLAPYRALGEPAARAVERGAGVAEALNRVLARRSPVPLAGGRLHFVPQAALPPGEAYESFVARTAGVPTRDDRHDFFNGLVWLRWPAWKRRLNELHAAAIAAQPPGARRGALRDALTLFDESAALLRAPPAFIARLRAHDWQALCVDNRADWRDARLVLFGHALLAQLAAAPYKALTAKVWTGRDPASLQPPRLAGKPFLALPVLGVPGWCPANEDPAFYADRQVFRPLRASAGQRIIGS